MPLTKRKRQKVKALKKQNKNNYFLKTYDKTNPYD
jgi:hypothetical protein